MYILYVTKQLTESRTRVVLHNLFLLDMSILNELVIKNDPVKKATPFFVFMERVQLTHYQVLVLEDRIFHRKVLSKL